MAVKSLPGEAAISRKGLAWLLAAQIFIVAPHFSTVPAWIAILWLAVASWRWQIFQGAWDYPNKINKTLVIAICVTGLALTFKAHFSFESMVSLLLVGFILKLLEMKTRKDFVLLIFIALFILATQFIAFNHFLMALYGLGCLLLLCATLMQLYRNPTPKNLWEELRPSVYLLLQAVPFMILLFVVVPRLGSFWAVPSPQHAKTGMSDSMAPGDFSELMQSNELAFRVAFSGAVPAQNQLYWRSLEFSRFDGRRWTQNRMQSVAASNTATVARDIELLGRQITYEIIAEPSGQPWLYVLAAPVRWSDTLVFARNMRLQAEGPVRQRMGYSVTSALDYRLHEIDARELQENLALPDQGNPQTRARAREWWAETGSAEKLIDKLFTYYQRSFFYTLRPPALGQNVIDEFLWQSRQGFCEHFASSFVYFMRAAGVPARVVVGYQGGTLNSREGYLAVHQRDAHAWAEVWLQDRGWVMFDPTAAVAPERIQKGVEASLSATDRQLLPGSFGSSFKFLRQISEQWDALNFKWARWVMNYDTEQQEQLLARLLGEVSPARMALLVLGGGGLSLLLIFTLLMLRTRQQPQPLWVQLYLQLCKKLQAGGVIVVAGETPSQLLERAILQHPNCKPALLNILHLYERFTYADELSLADELKRQIGSLSFKR